MEEDLLHVMIELAGGVDGELFEAGVGALPPILGNRVSGHLFHICLVILADVLVVREQQVAVDEDGVIAQVALGDGLQNTGPGVGVQFDVLIDLVLFQFADLAKTYHCHE